MQTQPCATSAARPLAGRVALITGAASGLGAALTSALADAGASVIAADINGAGAADLATSLATSPPTSVASPRATEVATSLANSLATSVSTSVSTSRSSSPGTSQASSGQRVWSMTLDVSDSAAVPGAVAAAYDHFGGLDILINNAGTDVTLPLEELSPEQWLRVIATNLTGPFLMSRAVTPYFRAAGTGHIINIASTAAKRAWPNASAYHASKWGLLGLSHALHAELRLHGIKVTAVVAGGMRTPFLLERFPDIDPALLQDPADVARAILPLLLMPADSVAAELTVLPMREVSWP